MPTPLPNLYDTESSIEDLPKPFRATRSLSSQIRETDGVTDLYASSQTLRRD